MSMSFHLNERNGSTLTALHFDTAASSILSALPHNCVSVTPAL